MNNAEAIQHTELVVFNSREEPELEGPFVGVVSDGKVNFSDPEIEHYMAWDSEMTGLACQIIMHSVLKDL